MARRKPAAPRILRWPPTKYARWVISVPQASVVRARRATASRGAASPTRRWVRTAPRPCALMAWYVAASEPLPHAAQPEQQLQTASNYH